MAYELQSTFELTGTFWRPEDPEARISGILRYTAGRVTLDLVGSFGVFEQEDVSETETILGLTNNGLCTLRKAYRSDSSWTVFGEDTAERSTWSALHLFVGAAFAQSEDAVFSAMQFGFEQLERWLATPAFEMTIEKGEKRRTIASHESAEPVRVELGALAATMILGTTFRAGGDSFRSLDWSRDAHFTIETAEPQSFEWFMDRLGELRALIGLLIGEAVTPTTIVGVTPGDPQLVSVCFSVRGEPTERLLHPAEMLMTYPKLGARFPDVAQPWFERRDALRTVVALFFGTLYAPQLPLEFRFLALTQALETLHRQTHGGLYLTEEEYEPVRKVLVDAIPGGIPTDLRQSLKTRIGFGNELSQRRRFRELLDDLDGDARAVVTSDPTTYIGRIVEMRNHLTHYPVGAMAPMGNTELFYETVKLRAFLTLLLLAEVGITGVEAAEGVRRTRWHRGFLGT